MSSRKKKLQALKASIKEWCKDDIKRSNDTCFSIKARLSDLDKLFDNGLSNEELVAERISLLKELHNLNKCHSLDMAQKAKVRWVIEGDENSKYFHEIINKKRSQLAVRGVITDGEWIDEPCKVKSEFLKQFANRFECPSGPCIDIDSDMFKKLSTEQVADLECDVTFDEIKKANLSQNSSNSDSIESMANAVKYNWGFRRKTSLYVPEGRVGKIKENFVHHAPENYLFSAGNEEVKLAFLTALASCVARSTDAIGPELISFITNKRSS
nr:RNA-directed DNA polymerase, eukaryota [Tanacetum cinerariifolium]